MKQGTHSFGPEKPFLGTLPHAQRVKHFFREQQLRDNCFTMLPALLGCIFCSSASTVWISLLCCCLVTTWRAAGTLHSYLCKAEFGCQQFVIVTSYCRIGMFPAEWQLSNLSLHVSQIKEPWKSPVSKGCQANKHKETTISLDSRDKLNNY